MRHRLTALAVALAAALLLVAAVPGPAAAQGGAGTSTAAVLRLDPAPRSLALGGAYAPVAREPMSLFYNPARLDFRETGFGFSYQALPVDAGAGAMVASTRVGPGAIAIGSVFLNYGEVEVFEPDPSTGGERGVPTGERVGGGETVLGVGYALPLGAALRVGFGVKLLRLQIAEAAGSGMAFDLGASLDLFDERLSLSLAAQNFGPEAGAGRPAELPRIARVGTALRLVSRDEQRWTLAVEASHRDGGISLASGIEAEFSPGEEVMVVGRLGYRESQGWDDAIRPREAVVLGAGVKLGRYAIEYAQRPFGVLGSTHHFGLSIRTAAGAAN